MTEVCLSVMQWGGAAGECEVLQDKRHEGGALCLPYGLCTGSQGAGSFCSSPWQTPPGARHSGHEAL